MTTKDQLSLLPDFKGKRIVKLCLRTAHLIAISGIFGAALYEVNHALIWDFWLAAIITGGGLLAIDALSNLIWFIQVRGIVIMTKIGLLAMIPFAPNWITQLLLLAMILSGIISHAPSQWRYYSILHQRVIKSKNDIKG